MNVEALRQQQFVETLWAAGAPDAGRGWRAYRGNAGAAAQRALAAAFPTVAALIGDDAFAALARAHWHAEPPSRGDLACFGSELPASLDRDAQLADVPYLADVARLEWALHRAGTAADVEPELESLALLADVDPQLLAIALMPGSAVLDSRWPIVTLWQAHRPGGDFAAARTALAQGRGETALVDRDGFSVRCRTIDADSAAFARALLGGADLAAALAAAGEAFDFAAWLVSAVREQRIACVRQLAPATEPSS